MADHPFFTDKKARIGSFEETVKEIGGLKYSAILDFLDSLANQIEANDSISSNSEKLVNNLKALSS